MVAPPTAPLAEKVWIDGKLVAWDSATTHLLTHTLHYELGAFEGIRCYKRLDGRSAIFRLDEHLVRLYNSCKICLIDVPFPKEAVHEACSEVIRANGFREAYLRPLVF